MNYGLVNILIADCYLHLDRFRAAIRVIDVALASTLPFSNCQRADALRLKANALHGRDGDERAFKPADELLEEAAMFDPKAKVYIAKIGGVAIASCLLRYQCPRGLMNNTKITPVKLKTCSGATPLIAATYNGEAIIKSPIL